MSQRADAARATLQRANLDPDRAVDDWPAVLTRPDAAALLAALGDLGTPAAAALLVALEPQAPKTARRAIRRALYGLAQRGIAVPAAPPAATAPARGKTHFEGYLSAFDGRGDRIGWLLHAPPGDATTIVIAVFNEPDGLRDVRATSTTRSQLRVAKQRFVLDNRVPLVPVAGDALDALLLEAHDRLTTRTRAQDYRRLRQQLTSVPPLDPIEPQSTKASPPDPAAAFAALARSADLLAEPEIAQWWPAPAALAPFVEQLRELRESPIVLAPEQQDRQLRQIVDAAARAIFPAPTLCRRLRGTAYVFAETHRPDAAQLALAVVHALTAAPTTTDVPLTTTLLHRALGTVLAAQESERQPERAGSLIVTPDEALRGRAPSRPPHTRG